MKVYFNSQDSNFKDPFGAVEIGTEVTFRIEAAEVDGVVLRTWTDDGGETRIEMQQEGNFYVASATAPETPCLFWYYFLIYANGTQYYYGNNTDRLGGEGALYDWEPDSFQITVHKPISTPEWFRHSIVYYIFPDRFARGSDYEERKEAAALPDGWKGPGKVFEEDWYKRPSYEKNDDGTIKNWQFYGGTLEGIIEKLPYIRSLGADAIYLCPIFKAGSNHRYDTADYLQIDPLLGDDAAFRKLCQAAADFRISIILDGVFSHTGCDSIYFDKYGNYGKDGAYGHPDSPYYPWYTFYEDGTYSSWWGDQNLPNVIEEEPSHQEFICGKNGVLNKWLDLGAAGWRLDVADELPDQFIKDIRTTIKSRPDGADLILIGEVWEDASNKISYGQKREYLFGDELDSVMNYPFRSFIIDYIMNHCSSAQFCARVMSIVENYPRQILHSVINMLGGHDRLRPLTALSMAAAIPEELQYDYVLQGIDYELARRRLKLATILQYTLPGVPVIYYGDEAGLQGHADPYNRAAYPWGREDEDILYHYKKLGLIYKQHSCLQEGDFHTYTMGDDVVVIERTDGTEKLVVLVNRNWHDPVVVAVDTKGCESAIDLYNSEHFDVTSDALLLSIEPTSARIMFLE